MQTYLFFVASTYGQGTYGQDIYNDSTRHSTTTPHTATENPLPTGSGTLANTGLLVAAITTLACVIIFAALIVRFWRRPASELVATDETINPDSRNDDAPQAPQR